MLERQACKRSIEGQSIGVASDFELMKSDYFIYNYVGCKRGPTRGLQSLRESEKNPNVKPFATIIEDMLRIVGKTTNGFIDECGKWVKEFRPLDARCLFHKHVNIYGS